MYKLLIALAMYGVALMAIGILVLFTCLFIAAEGDVSGEFWVLFATFFCAPAYGFIILYHLKD